ncbi:MAG: hypothetical protein ACI9W6_002947 [Motiliproteus sp.]|jgi:hypothetical protein
MFNSLFQPKPLLDDDSATWICHQFNWIQQQFDADYFLEQSPLVLPNNDFFPGRADSHQGMAQLLLDQVKRHAGLEHWPTELLEGRLQPDEPPGRLALPAQRGEQRGSNQPIVSQAVAALPVYFNPAQVNDPQAMVSSFAQSIGNALTQQAALPPHISAEQWPLLVELVAIYLGFGIPMTNSAFAFAGGCGGCSKRAAQRQAFLSQDEALFGLALFCSLKQLDAGQVLPHLKPHLKKLYKRACAQLEKSQLEKSQLEKGQLTQQ